MDMMDFWDRENEINQIKNFVGKGLFGFLTGRRRVGKTALLLKIAEKFKGLYHQAVEGTVQQQLPHLVEEWRAFFPIFKDVSPKNWSEFFGLLSRETLPPVLIFDEFPYWVAGDPSLPSILQKWIDHDLSKKKTLLLLSGSSQSMLYSQFSREEAPLYGRAAVHLHVEPLSYKWFCRVFRRAADDPASFERFALVGGVPHYWKLMPRGSLVDQADYLYFAPSAILSEEPGHIVRDEGVTGTLPKAILDLVGRGVSKPSEMAARLGTSQGNLSRPLNLLLELGLVQRELPFGESIRTTKRVLYTIQDAAISFYYKYFLPLRTRWQDMSKQEKRDVLKMHASTQWEIFCRKSCNGFRYWEEGVEIDLVTNPKDHKGSVVAECKWQSISDGSRAKLLEDLKNRFSKTRLSRRIGKVDFRIFSKDDLTLMNATKFII